MPSSSKQALPPYWEEPMDDDDDDEAETFGYVLTDPDRMRRQWVHDNYDALAELYHAFLETGRSLFGDCFYQNGGFHTFIWHVHDALQPERMTHD